MKKFKVAVSCLATYETVIDVAESMSLDEAIAYATNKIDTIPVGELNFISDTEKVEGGLCCFVEE